MATELAKSESRHFNPLAEKSGEEGKHKRESWLKKAKQLIERMHPDWDLLKNEGEAWRVMAEAKRHAAQIREALARGVAESDVLKHLADDVQGDFAAAMGRQLQEGRKLGKMESKIEKRMNEIAAELIAVQSGMEVKEIENTLGINLAETVLRLRDEPSTLPAKVRPPESGEGKRNDEEAKEGIVAAATGATPAPPEPKDVEERIKKAVDNMVKTAKDIHDKEIEAKRKAAEERGEKEEAEKDDKEGVEGATGEKTDAEELPDFFIEAKKYAIDLQDPRHLALFVQEVAKRQWNSSHESTGLLNPFSATEVALEFFRKTAQSVYMDLVKSTTYSQGRESAIKAVLEFGNCRTREQLLREMEYAGAVINRRRVREKKTELIDKLETLLKKNFGARGRFKPGKAEATATDARKVPTSLELEARYMRNVMKWTPAHVEQELERLTGLLDAAQQSFAVEGREFDQSRMNADLSRKISVLREWGGLKYKRVGEIDDALAKWQEKGEKGGEDIARRITERENRTERAAQILAAAFADPKRKWTREGRGMGELWNSYLQGHLSFMNLLRDMARFAPEKERGEAEKVLQWLELEIQKSGTRAATLKRRHATAFKAAVETIYGKNFKDAVKELCKEDAAFAPFMGTVGGVRITPTKGRAMQLYVSLLQEGVKTEYTDPETGEKKTLWTGGYHDAIEHNKRTGQAAALRRLFTVQDLRLLDWIGKWYEENRKGLSEASEDLFGIGVYAELPNYFPVKMLLNESGLEKPDAAGWAVFPRALTPRVRNVRDFDTRADILQMFMSRMDEAIQWQTHSRLGLEMRGIFGRAELQDAIKATHGAKANDQMLGAITDILVGHGKYDRSTAGVEYYTDILRGWAALAALSGNAGAMLKQTTSIPAFGFEIGLWNTARHMASAFTPDGVAAMKEIWNSEERKNRWEGGNSEEVANALRGLDARGLKKWFINGMILNRVGDNVPALVIGQGIYRDALARGMSKENAMAYTWMLVERTQQSSRIENQASFQRRNKLGRLLYQFLSTQHQYLQYQMRALREVAARPGELARYGRAARAVFLNHFALSSAYFWAGEVFRAALGKDPSDDQMKDWFVSMLTGPYGALFMAGATCVNSLNYAFKGRAFGGNKSPIPALDWAERNTETVIALAQGLFDHPKTGDEVLDEIGEFLDKFGKINVPLYRDWKKYRESSEKGYRFNVTGD
ncbi:MAG: hypothetical protein IJ802_06650 [Kiritimatiellae bacterium]|nr:hypothetical protein [Kiritimatiellia bacterium]